MMKGYDVLLNDLTGVTVEETADKIVKRMAASDASDDVDICCNGLLETAIVKPDVTPTDCVLLILEMQTLLETRSRSPQNSTTLKKALLTSVQKEYDSTWRRAKENGSEDKPVIVAEHRERWLRFMEFLGLLYANGLAHEKVVRAVMASFQKLGGNPDENIVVGACTLLLAHGVVLKLLSSAAGKEFMAQYQGSLSEIAKKKNRYLEVKPLIDDVFELVENGGNAPNAHKAKAPCAASKGKAHGKSNGERGEKAGKRTGYVDEDAGGTNGDFNVKGRGEKGKAGKSAEKGEAGKGEQNARQIYVAGIGDSNEDQIRALFQDKGEIERVKILRTPEGDSRDTCFVTFRREDQAQKAIRLHGTKLAGRTLTVRGAHESKGSEKGNHDNGKVESTEPIIKDERPVIREETGRGGSNRFDFLKEDSPGIEKNLRNDKGKNGKGGEKGAPQEPDPRQVFVAGIGGANEDDIRDLFDDVGDVDRIKILRAADGASREACFVTFRSEDQALKAIGLRGRTFEGKAITVRPAHGGKGNDRGYAGKGDRDNDGIPPDSGGSSRFGTLADGQPDRFGNASRGKGGKGNKSKGKGEWLSEMDSLIEEALQEAEGAIRLGDFDLPAKRFLSELRSRDNADGGDRFAGAMDQVLTFTAGKDRSAVRKWSAYVFTLLQKFDPELSEELKKRDEERRGGAPGGASGRRDDDRW